MKAIVKRVMIAVVALMVLGSTSVAFAQGPADGRQGIGFRGEVTFVGSSSITVLTRNDESITVSVTDQTNIRLPIDRSEGTLDDIETGNFVGVRGTKNDDGSINARLILVLPQAPRDMPQVRGKVTVIEGGTFVVENRDGDSQRVDTNENTHFRVGKQKAESSDIGVGDLILALGSEQDDGGFLAHLVNVVTGDRLKKHTLRGNVLSVNVEAGTLTVEAIGQKEGTWTVETSEDTKYRMRGVDNPTLADVQVGDQVGIVGKQSAGGDKSGVARMIAVIPEEFHNSIRRVGEVTEISGTSVEINTPRGEITVLTDESTEYRTRGDQDVSFDDVTIGVKVLVIGKLTDAEKTILAQVVGIQQSN